MLVDIQLLSKLINKVDEHTAELNEHVDVKSRLLSVRQHKPLMAMYFKHSIALNNALNNARVPSEHLETTLRRFALNANNDAKKIITFYKTYSHNFEDKGRLHFQMDLAEMVSLLKHRTKNEKEHLIPEYKMIAKEYPDAFS
jgi:hypothetical protein